MPSSAAPERNTAAPSATNPVASEPGAWGRRRMRAGYRRTGAPPPASGGRPCSAPPCGSDNWRMRHVPLAAYDRRMRKLVLVIALEVAVLAVAALLFVRSSPEP